MKEYLSADLKATQQLSDKLYRKLITVEYAKLMESVILTNKVSVCLAKIYKNGFSVDKNKLTEVKQEFEQEKNQIEGRLKEQVVQLMGDTPINLSGRKYSAKKLFALIGGSIGGGIAWEMAALYPSLTKNLIPIAADWKASDWIIANTFLQKRLLENSNDPLRDARIHAMLTYRTPASFSERFGRTKNLEKNMYNVESWLIHHGDKLFKRFLLQAYKTMNHLLASIDTVSYTHLTLPTIYSV